jgi:hypothetical protein
MKLPNAPVACKQIRVIRVSGKYCDAKSQSGDLPTRTGMDTGSHLVEFTTTALVGTAIEEKEVPLLQIQGT